MLEQLMEMLRLQGERGVSREQALHWNVYRPHSTGYLW